MGALLESGLVGNIGLKHLKVIKEDTINKWDKLGFLDGLKGHIKENMAQLYENQASYLINEAAATDSSGSFETVVFPIVRRVFSKLLANDLVSVQAMNLPIGKLFYFIPKIQGYDMGQDPTAGGSHIPPIGAQNGPSNTNTGYGSTDKNLYDRFYEGNEPVLDPPGLFDYSKGSFSAVTTSADTVVWSSGQLVTSAYTAGEYRKVLLKMTGFTTAGEGKLIGPDGQVMDNEAFLSGLEVYAAAGAPNINAAFSGLGTSPLLFRVVTQKYGSGIVQYGASSQSSFPGSAGSYGGNDGYYDNVCNQAGEIYLEVDAQVPCAIGANSIDGYSGITTTVTGPAISQFTCKWRVYKELEFEDRIGEVSFDLQSVTVSVTERKLRAQWSPELAQDVSAFHNIDAEAELTALLSEQVAAEIDREILRDLRKGAAWKSKWDYNEWKYGGTGQSTLQGYTQKDWNQTLVTKVNQMSAQIHKTT